MRSASVEEGRGVGAEGGGGEWWAIFALQRLRVDRADYRSRMFALRWCACMLLLGLLDVITARGECKS